MKRILVFELEDDKYVIKEDSIGIFAINGDDLKFDSLQFYNGIYKGDGKSTNIVLNNNMQSDTRKKVLTFING